MCEHARSMSAGEGADEEVPVGFHYPVFSNMRSMFGALQDKIKPVAEHSPQHVADISDLLTSHSVTEDEWRQFASFSETKYTRSLVAHDENFTVLLLCWNASQKSPIHDHAGSSCWVKVLAGTLRERRFLADDKAGGALEEISDATIAKGDVTYINDSMGLHEMSNPSGTEVTVTMHIYCPAFYSCHAYLMDGAKRQVSMLAATAPPREIVGVPQESYDDDVSNTSRASTPTTVSLVEFCELLNRAEDPQHAIVAAFEKVFLSSPEWSTYAHFSDFRFQRLLIHQTDEYSILMLCWLPGQATPPHDHRGSKSWVKVLRGALTFTVCENGEPMRDRAPTTLDRDSDVFVEDESLQEHILANFSQEYAVSLHLYNPPYTELHYGTNAASPTLPAANKKKDPSSACDSEFPTFSNDSGGSNSSNKKADGPVCKRKQLTNCVPVVQCQKIGGAHKPSCAISSECPLSNFAALLFRLDNVIVRCRGQTDLEELSVAVMDALDETNFCPKEIARYWDHKQRIGHRIRLHENATFNVSLNLWDPGQRSVAHDHDGSLAWVKVLDGDLMDISYEVVAPTTADAAKKPAASSSAASNNDDDAASPLGSTRVTRNAKIAAGTSCFYSAHSIHALRNRSATARATSLHVYWSVCNACRWYSAKSSKPIKVSSHSTKSDYWNVLRGGLSNNNSFAGTPPTNAMSSGPQFGAERSVSPSLQSMENPIPPPPIE